MRRRLHTDSSGTTLRQGCDERARADAWRGPCSRSDLHAVRWTLTLPSSVSLSSLLRSSGAAGFDLRGTPFGRQSHPVIATEAIPFWPTPPASRRCAISGAPRSPSAIATSADVIYCLPQPPSTCAYLFSRRANARQPISRRKNPAGHFI
jgi:hypothetical protein